MEIRITHVIELSSSLMALVAAAAAGAPASDAAFRPSPAPSPSPSPSPAPAAQSGDVDASAAADAGDVDAAGWPWSADLHAATKGKTKDGLWRMKVGVSRPDPKPGFPKDGATANGAGTPAPSTAGAEAAASPTPAPSAEEDDEFAAFRAAAAASDATDANAAASVPARKWTDADLGALCNQAAVKLGDPQPVKDVIAKYVPEGQVPHSRNVPEDKRAAFAADVEKAAGITFAG